MTEQKESFVSCVCGHVAVHHDQRKSIPQGLMADYKVIFACGWTGCGCPRYRLNKDPVVTVKAVNDLLAERLEQEAPNAAEALRFFVRQLTAKGGTP